MNKVKIHFSIKDLENLSGIKAHTLRIWEKRHAIFNPSRTETNIRYYSLEELQKLLNVSFLINYGYKISRVAKLSDEDLNKIVIQIYSEKTNSGFSISVLKIAMLNFDAVLFNQTYTELSKTKTFDRIFIEVYLPFLNEIGLLWQTNSIKPIHEHFVSNLIYQKLVENISLKQSQTILSNMDKTFVLFLPENEIHEISLMFANYLLICKGFKTIYLGSSVPFSDLLEINKLYNNIYYISNFTVMPTIDNLVDYLEKFEKNLLQNSSNELFVSGNQTKYLLQDFKSVTIFNSWSKFIDVL